VFATAALMPAAILPATADPGTARRGVPLDQLSVVTTEVASGLVHSRA
jgi:hypothetical protein